MSDPRILELLDLAAAEKLELPFSPEQIIELENAGHAVDLRTGEIIYHVDELKFDLTAVGQATIHLYSVEEV